MRWLGLYLIASVVFAWSCPAQEAELDQAYDTFASTQMTALGQMLQAYDTAYTEQIGNRAFELAQRVRRENAQIAFGEANPVTSPDQGLDLEPLVQARAEYRDQILQAQETLAALVQTARDAAAVRGDTQQAVQLNGQLEAVRKGGETLNRRLPLPQGVAVNRYFNELQRPGVHIPDELGVMYQPGRIRIFGASQHDVVVINGSVYGHFGKVISFENHGWAGWLRASEPRLADGANYILLFLDKRGRVVERHILPIDVDQRYQWKFSRDRRQVRFVMSGTAGQALEVSGSAFRIKGVAFAATVRRPGDQADLQVTYRRDGSG